MESSTKVDKIQKLSLSSLYLGYDYGSLDKAGRMNTKLFTRIKLFHRKHEENTKADETEGDIKLRALVGSNHRADLFKTLPMGSEEAATLATEVKNEIQFVARKYIEEGLGSGCDEIGPVTGVCKHTMGIAVTRAVFFYRDQGIATFHEYLYGPLSKDPNTSYLLLSYLGDDNIYIVVQL